MRRSLALAPAILLLAACGGQSNKQALQNAANQSDPAAAQVLNGAAENGMNPEQALNEAGQASASSNMGATPPSGSLQARPNSARNPNPKQPGQPIEKMATTNRS